jgi:hypothetical protein
MKTISLTIPMDCSALTRSAEMLTGLAADILEASILSTAPAIPEGQVNAGSVPRPLSELEEVIYNRKTAQEQFVEGLSFADKLAHFNEIAAEKVAALATAAKAETPDFQDSPHEKTPAEVFKPVIIDEISDFNGAPDDIIKRWNGALDGTRVHDEVILSRVAGDESETSRVLAEMESKSISPDQAAGAVDQHPGEGVELDGVGLPWDHRIHASSRAKLAKAPNCWKRKRGVGADVTDEVVAELRAAMSAGPDKPVAPAPAKPELPVAPATPAPVVPTDSTVATFPQLMAAITAGGITPAAVLAAVNLQGLTSLPLLASRSDLIPAVAETLGL